MRTAGGSWRSLEKAEQDEAEGRARGREAPAAPAGPAGRVGAHGPGRAGRSGQAGSERLPGLVLGFTPEPGEEKRGRDRSFNPFGTRDPRDPRDRDGWGRGGALTPKCGSRCSPPRSWRRRPSECPQGVSPAVSPPCPHTWVSQSESPTPHHQVLSTQSGPPTPIRVPPSLCPQPLTQAHVPSWSPSLSHQTNVTTLCPQHHIPSL